MCLKIYPGNTSSIFSRNSQANASEFLENIESKNAAFFKVCETFHSMKLMNVFYRAHIGTLHESKQYIIDVDFDIKVLHSKIYFYLLIAV